MSNTSMRKLNKKSFIKVLIFNFFLLIGSIALGERIAAKMMALEQVNINKLIDYYKNEPQTEKSFPSNLDWAVFARDVVGVESIPVQQSSSMSSISSSQIERTIRTKISSTDWQPLTDIKAKNSLKKWRPHLKESFGTDSYSWAWVLFQESDTANSKKILQTLFNTEHEKVMKLKTARYGFGGTPLSELTKIQNTLLLLSSEEEKPEIEKKVKEAKVHISNIPSSQILT